MNTADFKTYRLYLLTSLVVLLFLATPIILFAQTDNPTLQYSPLINTGFETGDGISAYVNNIYYLSIGLAALLAVIKITIAGVKWMLSDVVTDKSQAKKDIRGSLLGLVIIVLAVFVLNIINPTLTELDQSFTLTNPGVDYNGFTICPESGCDAIKNTCESRSFHTGTQVGVEQPDGETVQAINCESPDQIAGPIQCGRVPTFLRSLGGVLYNIVACNDVGERCAANLGLTEDEVNINRVEKSSISGSWSDVYCAPK